MWFRSAISAVPCCVVGPKDQGSGTSKRRLWMEVFSWKPKTNVFLLFPSTMNVLMIFLTLERSRRSIMRNASRRLLRNHACLSFMCLLLYVLLLHSHKVGYACILAPLSVFWTHQTAQLRLLSLYYCTLFDSPCLPWDRILYRGGVPSIHSNRICAHQRMLFIGCHRVNDQFFTNWLFVGLSVGQGSPERLLLDQYCRNPLRRSHSIHFPLLKSQCVDFNFFHVLEELQGLQRV